MSFLRKTTTALILMLVLAPSALAEDGGVNPDAPTPVVISTPTQPVVPGNKVVIRKGLAYAPAAAPDAVKRVIWAGNKIRSRPYVWGGGHAAWIASGYDCSGSVSYALHGAGLLRQPLVSGEFASWGAKGAGTWITIYANGGHVYMTVAGARFDTSGATAARSRWQRDMRSPRGYTVRHPVGL